MSLLLVDDDAALLDALAMAFEDAGFSVRTAGDGQQALALHRDDPAEVIVSDVNMPFMDGFTLCRTLREGGDDVALLLLTSRDSEIDEALGLDLGADDYVAKPFSTRILVARVNALRRRRRVDTTGEIIVAGDLLLDVERLTATFMETVVVVTLTEFKLLEALCRRPGIVWNRDKLMDAARGDDSVVAPRIIDTYVRRLRRKFEAVDPEFGAIETVVGAGYRWRA